MRPRCLGTTNKRRLQKSLASRAQLSISGSPAIWTDRDRRRQPCSDDTTVLSLINMAVADLPTYGYRPCGAAATGVGADYLPVVNAKAGVSHFKKT